eukprot:1181317-Prorocentrum_minimum.AAC.1
MDDVPLSSIPALLASDWSIVRISGAKGEPPCRLPARRRGQGWVEELRNGSQSLGGREHILDAGANHRGKESIFLMREPITGVKRAYS